MSSLPRHLYHTGYERSFDKLRMTIRVQFIGRCLASKPTSVSSRHILLRI